MSSIIENKAYMCSPTGRSVHFRDFTWKKTPKWKIYKGFCRGTVGQMKKVLLKVPVVDVWTEEDCDREIQKYKQLQKLAIKFNREVVSNSNMKIVVPEKAIIDRTAGIHNLKFRKRTLSRNEWVLVFEKIESPLVTFVNKKGDCNRQSARILNAFVHFTFLESCGSSVVSKLQGVSRGTSFILSCPLTHTDHHDVLEIMRNHKCNDICNGFPTPESPMPAHAEHGVETTFQPWAPTSDECDSDEEVFCHLGLSEEEQDIQFTLQRDITNQFYAIPHPAQHMSHPNYGQNIIPDQRLGPPPAYSSQCPTGHREVMCGNWDDNFNLLLLRDSAFIQQTSGRLAGLS